MSSTNMRSNTPVIGAGPLAAGPLSAGPLSAGPLSAGVARDGAPRRRATSGGVGSYSRLVRLMKVALPLCALAILTTVVAWPSFVEPPGGRTSVDAGESELLRPRFYSVDENGQPFSMTAESAHEPDGDGGIVDLVAPSAEMTENAGTWVTLSSRTGTYDKRTDILHMVGEVHIIRDDGTEYVTPEAYANVKSGDAWGDAPVRGQGPQGEIDAKGFRLTDRGKTIVFVNQSAASLPPGGGPTGGAAPSAGPSAAPSAGPVPSPPAPSPPVPSPPVPSPPVPSPPIPLPPIPSAAPSATATAITATPSLIQRPPAPPPPPKREAGASSPGFVPPPPPRKPSSR